MHRPEILDLLAGLVVVGFSLFLLGLGLVCMTKPAVAKHFLTLFASSASAHYLEQGVRLLVGLALLTFADSMRFPASFRFLGWIIVVTTTGLLLIPWQWHNKFSARVMPPLLRRLPLLALGAVALGTFILYSVVTGAR